MEKKLQMLIYSRERGDGYNARRATESLVEFVPDSIASSSGFDRHQNEILSAKHPKRQEIVGASDDIHINSEHSSIQGMNCRFPRKEAVKNLTKHWKFPVRVSFHPKGWIIFRFEAEQQANAVVGSGPYVVFGIQLALSHLPSDFRSDYTGAAYITQSAPKTLERVRYFLDTFGGRYILRGRPLYTIYTLSKHNLAGPKVLILIDAKKEPLESVTLQLNNGISFLQSISLDYYLFFCTRDQCAGGRAPDRTNIGTRPPPRNHYDSLADNGGWQEVKNRRNRNGRSCSQKPANRAPFRAASNAPPRSKSRPPIQKWQPKIQEQQPATTPLEI